MSGIDGMPYYVAGDWYECAVDDALSAIARNEVAAWVRARASEPAPLPNPDAWVGLTTPRAGRNRAERRARR